MPVAPSVGCVCVCVCVCFYILLEMRVKAQRDSPVLVLYAASSVAGLPNDNLPHPYLRQRFSVTVQPTPTKFGVNIVR